jgi:hypothetical protein
MSGTTNPTSSAYNGGADPLPLVPTREELDAARAAERARQAGLDRKDANRIRLTDEIDLPNPDVDDKKPCCCQCWIDMIESIKNCFIAIGTAFKNCFLAIGGWFSTSVYIQNILRKYPALEALLVPHAKGSSGARIMTQWGNVSEEDQAALKKYMTKKGAAGTPVSLEEGDSVEAANLKTLTQYLPIPEEVAGLQATLSLYPAFVAAVLETETRETPDKCVAEWNRIPLGIQVQIRRFLTDDAGNDLGATARVLGKDLRRLAFYLPAAPART